MATLLTEWGVDSASSSATSMVTNPNATLPVGTTLVVGVCIAGAVFTPGTITDSGGNTWVKATFTGGTNVALFASRLTTQLTAASTITVTFGATATRLVLAAAALSDTVSGPVTLGTFNETASTPVIGGTVTPAAAALVFGATSFLNSGRIFTAGAGYTAGVKHLSTVGAGDRGIQLVWRDGVASTPYAQIGTLNSSGTNDTCLGSIATGSGGGGPAFVTKPVKVWDGSVWRTCPVKVWSGSAWVTKPTKVYQ